MPILSLTVIDVIYHFLLRAHRDKTAKSVAQNDVPETLIIDKSGANLAALEAINAHRKAPIKMSSILFPRRFSVVLLPTCPRKFDTYSSPAAFRNDLCRKHESPPTERSSRSND